MASTLNTKFAGGVLIGATLAALAGVTLRSGYVAKDVGNREVIGTLSGTTIATGRDFVSNNPTMTCLRTNGASGRCASAYIEQAFTASGNMLVAQVQLPTSLFGTGADLLNHRIQCRGTPYVKRLASVITTSGQAGSGSAAFVLRTPVTSASGMDLGWSGSTIRITKGNYLTAIYGSGTVTQNAANDCLAKWWLDDKY